MLTQRPAHKLPSPISAGQHTASPGTASPLERNPLSPKGWKKRDSDGVGLSIVSKLETFAGDRRRMPHVGSEASCGGKRSLAAAGEFPVADLLSCCYLCRKSLHGKDIYMYRGEKAFCSKECRYEQIVTDEFLNKKGSLKF
ncbi:FCS-Like Zinc finger 13-like [Dendrobium catenatum]|uniref:FLZ-type domain-containing protein n=1 Tax=Dendrobium catenatum TaxID=906689 RepID=A0A2I0V7X8_9ASPA|nr:FCS-Like Zinc finger 13-like [Dendrobium catenatum]PKU59513.1 hypothetical protein MA16_Dca028805 [Dendrobium catenatum]